jgi:uncharacterized membrane protein YhhN
MNNMFLLPAILLAAAAVTDLAFIISDNTKLRVFSKPALLPLIIFLYLSLTANPAWFILGGLIAGWIGDILLLSKRPASFLSGLSSFLIGHIFYIAALLQGIGQVSMTPGIFSLILAMMLAAWLILRLIWPKERQYQSALILYSAGLAGLGLTAGVRLLTLGGTGNAVAAAGAATFILSDTLLGYHYFKRDFPGAQIAIMSSYLIAQLGIVIGLSAF